jgi:hypothetical protein
VFEPPCRVEARRKREPDIARVERLGIDRGVPHQRLNSRAL